MFDNFNQPVNLYCERLSHAFWAEPINALTNIAFILAAVFAYGLWRHTTPKARDILVLIILAVVVGIGSFIFHTIATSGAMLADVIPIEIFIIYGIFLIFTRVFGTKHIYAFVAVAAFATFNVLVINAFGRSLFNGSIQYVPTFVMLVLVAFFAMKKHYLAGKDFLFSSLIFLVSLACRSADKQICPHFEIGTHFLWHVLNALTMYYVMRGIIESAKSRE